ncbi:hypothetical protein [Lysinibacillus sp. NPDC047702]|uniref:hypothetical protein n=1 Tax=unclassified Lysinibacillus TaxID=2636778 RepID=UPI003D063001
MIYFLMNKSKCQINEKFISTLLNEVLAKGNVIYEVTHIIEYEGIYNYKIILEDGTEFFLEVLYRSYSKVDYLDIYIKESIGEFVTNKFVEKLKIELKNRLLEHWEQCHWIRDSQSADLSEKAYVKIHRLENKLREAINIIMLRRYGEDWWDKYAPISIQKKYHERKKHFQTVAQSFKGVEDKLLSVDVGDLIEIIKRKKNILDTENIENLIKSYESLAGYGKLDDLISSYKNFEKEFKKHLLIEEDLWKELFSNHFDEEFFSKWASFNKGRNHIAHNKLVDTAAYNKIIKDISEVEIYIDKLNEHIEMEPSDEEVRVMIEEMEEQSLDHMLEIMELESGIEIKGEEEIVEDFNQYIKSFIEELEDLYYFREGIDVTVNEINQDEQTIEIIIFSRERDGVYLCIESYIEIDSEPGQESTLILRFKEEEEVIENCRVTLFNGQAVYDVDKGYYVPIVNNEIYSMDFEEFQINVKSSLENLFHDYREDLDIADEASIRDGGSSVIADLSCEECGEEYISLDESVYEYGRCANCGHLHQELITCERCETVYNQNIDGNEMFCDNCLEWIDAQ